MIRRLVGQKTNLVEAPSLRGLIFGLLVVSLLGAFPKDACLREIVEQKLVYFLPQPILPMMGWFDNWWTDLIGGASTNRNTNTNTNTKTNRNTNTNLIGAAMWWLGMRATEFKPFPICSHLSSDLTTLSDRVLQFSSKRELNWKKPIQLQSRGASKKHCQRHKGP